MALQSISVTGALAINESLEILSQTITIQPASGLAQQIPPVTSFNSAVTPLDAVLPVTMTGSAVNIDLTSLATSYNGTVDMNAQKPQYFMFVNTGSHPMLIAGGASNGYSPVSGDTFSVPIPAGGFALLGFNNNSQVVGSSAKIIAATGTSGDILNVALVSG